MDKRLKAFENLLNIMDDLREKCPWDQKQTFESLSHLTIEETYELIDAIGEKDYKSLEGEIGDIFLHLVFYSKIGSEKGLFDITSVLNKISEKLIYRHPHIYGDVTVADEEEVKANWEKLKLKEGRKSVLEGVPKGLPALVKAQRIQDKVKGVGFEFENSEDVWQKVEEELKEFKDEFDKNSELQENEFGDLLFSLINFGRFHGIIAESALNITNSKFIKRFKEMEEMILLDKKNIENMQLEEMDTYWNKAKIKLKE